MGRKTKKKTILSNTLPIPDVKKDFTPEKKPIQYNVIYPKKESKPIKNDNTIIKIVEDDIIRFEELVEDLKSLGYNNVVRHLDRVKENNLDNKYYTCLCGSVFLKSDSKIEKHNKTKKHLNFINKDINSSWNDILNNNIYCINLNRYIDRFIYFKKESSRLGFKKVIRVSGFDGNKYRHEDEELINTNLKSTKTYQLAYDKLNELGLKHSIKYVDNHDEKPFVGGQLGCAVSHYETIKNAYDNKLKYVFIFEDDIIGHQHWNYSEELWNNTPKDFDILYLNVDVKSNKDISNNFIYKCKNNDKVGIISKSTFGQHSYIMTYKGMEKYLNYVKQKGIFCIDIDLKDMCSSNILKYYNWVSLDRNNKENNETTNFSLLGQVVNLPLSIHNHRKGSYFNNIEGWCCPEKEEDLFKWINKMNCKSGLEIGVFGGSSLIRAGHMFKANNGHLVGIDPYCFVDSNKYDEEETENYKWWKELDYDNIYNGCVNSLSRYELNNNVDLIKINSDEYHKKIPDKCLDFLHIDGNHTEEQSCLDVKNYLPKCKNGCVIFLDDIGWDSVHKARDILRKKCKMIKETIQEDTGNSWGIYLYE